jgi:PAS domain-containing protein
MPANQIEIILTRQMADSLSIPVFLTDPEGNLLFYNEPAEELLGKRFAETGALSVAEWSTMFKQMDDDGQFIPPSELPLVQTLNKRCPHHRTIWIESLEVERNKISITAYPIMGKPNRFLGAVAIFWKNEAP